MNNLPLWVKLSFAIIVFIAISAAIEHWPDKASNGENDQIEIHIRLD